MAGRRRLCVPGCHPCRGVCCVLGWKLVPAVKGFKIQILSSCSCPVLRGADSWWSVGRSRGAIKGSSAPASAALSCLLGLRGTMPSPGHRLRDVEHRPLLAEDDSYDSSSSSSEADAADRVWFIRDGCGMICAVMTWLLVVYADFVVTFVMLLPSKDFWYSVVNGVLFNCLAVLALSSHLRTMLTDPVSTSHPACGQVAPQTP